jgi:hypothetical protein
MAALAADLGVLRTLETLTAASHGLTALAIVVAAACSHVESLSNAYSPFSRDLGKAGVAGALATSGTPSPVSIQELISQPGPYHRRRVRAEGYVRLQFEGNTLCPVEKASGWASCLWLDVEGLEDPGFRRGRVVVEGTFDGENLGHLGLAGGTIGKITVLRRLQ